MLWLILLGALGATLIWAGDIVYLYGLFGLLIAPMRNVAPRKLFITAGVALLLLSVTPVSRGLSRKSTRDAAMAARAVEAQGRPLTAEQQDAQEGMGRGVPTRSCHHRRICKRKWTTTAAATRASWSSACPPCAHSTQVPVYFRGGADIWGLMLIGIGLYSSACCRASVGLASTRGWR